MAEKMTTCKTCGAQIAKNAKTCPHCGGKQKGSAGKIVLGVVIALLAIGLFGSGGGEEEKVDGPNVAAPGITETILEPAFIDTEISDCEVKYIKHGFTQNKVGEKCFAVWLEFTNNSDSNKAFYTTVTVKLFQNGVEVDGDMFKVNDESDNATKEIQPGTTVTVCRGYELPSSEDNVTLEVWPWISIGDTPSGSMLLSLTETVAE